MILEKQKTMKIDAFADEQCRRLIRRLQTDPAATFNLSGPSDAHKSWLAWFLAVKTNRIPCVLVPDELRARTVASDIMALSGQPVLIFRARELSLTDAEAVSHEMEQQRMAILSRILQRDLFALVVPAAAALQKLPPVSVMEKRTILLRVGMKCDPEQFVAHLLQNGYEHMRLADGAGQFARRGDIVDVVLPAAEDNADVVGIRFSFFDNEIDAIKQFDPQTQRSGLMMQEALIYPVREVLIDPDEKDLIAEQIREEGKKAAQSVLAHAKSPELAERLRRLTERDADRINNRLFFAALDRWIGDLYPESGSILDYAQKANMLLLVDEPIRLRQRADAAQADLYERIRSLIDKGQLLPMASDLSFTSLDLGKKIDKMKPAVALCQISSSGNGLPGAVNVQIKSRPADSYRGRENQLIQDIQDWKREGYEVILFAGSENRRKRLEEICTDHEIQPRILDVGLARGFVWPDAKLAVIGTQDLFGTERHTRRRRYKGDARIDFFSDLVPGEWVVHEAHGIGRYEGLVNMESGKGRRDYLKITYANDDALYIPVESLDQIQRYVGVDGKEPHLSRLSSQEWTRAKERARTSIRKLATDLIHLYAERSALKGHQFSPDTIWQLEFEEQFPYEETEDQLRTTEEIKKDMESEKVMDRLLCGDVGYGKTEVAFRAIFKCVMDGCQAALLAPTTVLAQQHYENICQRLKGFPIRVGLLSRFVSQNIQKNTLNDLLHGRIDVVVGTHRLLSNDVRFKNLGLLIVDEEQRFGVDHKEKLKAMWPTVDVLTLSATPIPRTLHMAMSGIRDISVLEEPPQDRRPIQTYVMEYDREMVIEAILRELSRKGQVFYLFNDTLRIAEKASELERLLPGARVVCAHGKMNERDLEDMMSAFIGQEADILVCTTIIENGIDMPNVNTIIVEDADRLGLAQLYQLRGRVGRSDRQAYAYITYRKDKVLTEISEKRLSAIRDFTELGSGFKIALRDLEVRGAGNLLGAEQHGHLEAIGYDLYCRMLEEAILEQKGLSQPARVETVIDLDVDAFIPKSYIPDEGQRLDIYRRMVDVRSLSDYQDVLDECLDRFGELPPAVLALADIAYVRGVAGRFGFRRIEQRQQHLILTYDEKIQPDLNTLSKIINQSAFKGRILFNAGNQPYLVYRQAAQNKQMITKQLRCLFMAMEPEEKNASA